MKWSLVLLSGLIIGMALTGCSKDTKVIVTLTLQDEMGEDLSSGVKFNLLPYDIESIRDSLQIANNSPEQPDREELLALREEYEEVNGQYSAHLEEYREAEAEVKQIKDLTSNRYKNAYKRYTDAKAKNKKLHENREEARSRYIDARKGYDEEMSKWEEDAYQGLDDVIAAKRSERGITEDYLIKTDKEGKGRVVVPGGSWWIYGKERHPTKKYTWLIWNEPIEATGGELEIELSKDDATEWTE